MNGQSRIAPCLGSARVRVSRVQFIAGPKDSEIFELPFITFIAWLSLAIAALLLPFKSSEDDQLLLLALLVVAVTWTGLQANELADVGKGSDQFGAFLVGIQLLLLAVMGLRLAAHGSNGAEPESR